MNQSMQLPSDGDHTGRDLGAEELELVRQALESGTLTSTKGTLVSSLEKEFPARYGMRFAHACTSGSAAVHCAVAALDLEPGDEIITTPITDMGALTAIVYQGQVPVFCDVDPDSYLVTAETIGFTCAGELFAGDRVLFAGQKIAAVAAKSHRLPPPSCGLGNLK